MKKAVYIRWHDAASRQSDWASPNDIPDKPLAIQSIGWLVKENDDLVAITVAYDEDNPEWGEDTGVVLTALVIPKSCIIEMRTIRLRPSRATSKDGDRSVVTSSQRPSAGESVV